jgi:glycosyltransferase involved in cell wall biosynthesis
MKRELSILIPVYNAVCTAIVKQIAMQCEQAKEAGMLQRYEIVVADDGSPDTAIIEQNRQLSAIDHCRFIEKRQNSGSAATRNFLARESQYEWLLFLDADMQIADSSFISRYLTCETEADVVNGGIAIGECTEGEQNLRYRYEKHEEPNHTAAKRQLRPYRAFRSTNFMIRRSVMLGCPFDERFLKSGYEDVLFGKHLWQRHISVQHIDNPTVMNDFENNPDFVAKTERSLQTLHRFRDDLQGFSRLLTLTEGIHIGLVKSIICFGHWLFGWIERRNLCSRHPSLRVYSIYKLGYYLSLTKSN